MKLNLSVILSFSGPVLGALQRKDDPPGCHADNCLRDIRVTFYLAQASIDCSSFLLEAAIPAPVTVTATATVNGVAQRAVANGPIIPTYASDCIGVSQYSSACSCIGVTATTTTLPPYSTTTTTTVTPTPTCTPQLCSTGFKPTCNPDSTSCFCFRNSENAGFCGTNAPCDGLTSCKGDDDCLNATGDTCAFGTCCGNSDANTGVCLVGLCDNPLAKLKRMARALERVGLVGNSAAFRGIDSEGGL